jgi:hypothetical protein
MSSLKVRAWWTADGGRGGSWLMGLLMWSDLKRRGVRRVWKWWDTRERFLSGVEVSELVWVGERKEKIRRSTSSQREGKVRAVLDIMYGKN